MTTENLTSAMLQLMEAHEIILVTNKKTGIDTADIQFTFIGAPIMTNHMEALKDRVKLFMSHIETIEKQKQQTTPI